MNLVGNRIMKTIRNFIRCFLPVLILSVVLGCVLAGCKKNNEAEDSGTKKPDKTTEVLEEDSTREDTGDDAADENVIKGNGNSEQKNTVLQEDDVTVHVTPESGSEDSESEENEEQGELPDKSEDSKGESKDDSKEDSKEDDTGIQLPTFYF